MDLPAEELPGEGKQKQTRRKKSRMGRLPSEITREELAQWFHLPAEEAARVMRVSLTVLKRVARRHGVLRWPYRKVKSLTRALSQPIASTPTTPCGSQLAGTPLSSTLSEPLAMLQQPPSTSHPSGLTPSQSQLLLDQQAAMAAAAAATAVQQVVGPGAGSLRMPPRQHSGLQLTMEMSSSSLPYFPPHQQQQQQPQPQPQAAMQQQQLGQQQMSMAQLQGLMQQVAAASAPPLALATHWSQLGVQQRQPSQHLPSPHSETYPGGWSAVQTLSGTSQASRQWSEAAAAAVAATYQPQLQQQQFLQPSRAGAPSRPPVHRLVSLQCPTAHQWQPWHALPAQQQQQQQGEGLQGALPQLPAVAAMAPLPCGTAPSPGARTPADSTNLTPTPTSTDTRGIEVLLCAIEKEQQREDQHSQHLTDAVTASTPPAAASAAPRVAVAAPAAALPKEVAEPARPAASTEVAQHPQLQGEGEEEAAQRNSKEGEGAGRVGDDRHLLRNASNGSDNGSAGSSSDPPPKTSSWQAAADAALAATSGPVASKPGTPAAVTGASCPASTTTAEVSVPDPPLPAAGEQQQPYPPLSPRIGGGGGAFRPVLLTAPPPAGIAAAAPVPSPAPKPQAASLDPEAGADVWQAAGTMAAAAAAAAAAGDARPASANAQPLPSPTAGADLRQAAGAATAAAAGVLPRPSPFCTSCQASPVLASPATSRHSRVPLGREPALQDVLAQQKAEVAATGATPAGSSGEQPTALALQRRASMSKDAMDRLPTFEWACNGGSGRTLSPRRASAAADFTFGPATGGSGGTAKACEEAAAPADLDSGGVDGGSSEGLAIRLATAVGAKRPLAAAMWESSNDFFGGSGGSPAKRAHLSPKAEVGVNGDSEAVQPQRLRQLSGQLSQHLPNVLPSAGTPHTHAGLHAHSFGNFGSLGLGSLGLNSLGLGSGGLGSGSFGSGGLLSGSDSSIGELNLPAIMSLLHQAAGMQPLQEQQWEPDRRQLLALLLAGGGPGGSGAGVEALLASAALQRAQAAPPPQPTLLGVAGSLPSALIGQLIGDGQVPLHRSPQPGAFNPVHASRSTAQTLYAQQQQQQQAQAPSQQAPSLQQGTVPEQVALFCLQKYAKKLGYSIDTIALQQQHAAAAQQVLLMQQAQQGHVLLLQQAQQEQALLMQHAHAAQQQQQQQQQHAHAAQQQQQQQKQHAHAAQQKQQQ